MKNLMIKIFCISVLLTMLISSISFVTIIKGLTLNSKMDYDPLEDIEITVEIIEIRSFEQEDPQVHFEEIIDKNSDPDFYLKIYINNEEFTSETWNNTKYLYDLGWKATLNVPDDQEFVDIKIQLWDSQKEENKDDRLCDISKDYPGTDDGYDVELTYDVKSGRWTGDDYLTDDFANFDLSGYGRLSGCDDGTIYSQDRDCEIRFNIYQNDFDGDGIPYWIEENTYLTDPELNNSGDDPDNDGIPTEWEWKWGYDPFIYDDHKNIDPDEDSINNFEEYLTSQWSSDPFRKDVFVELDIMEEGPNGEKTYFPDGAEELIKTAFNRRNIVFHLDFNTMGGTDIIPFIDKASRRDLQDIYKNYFSNTDENSWRIGVFHYGLVVYSTESAAGFMFRQNAFQISSKGHEKISEEPWADRVTVYASAYMHELGHTFGFWPIPGHNKYSMYPWQIGWWLNRPYKSCMNYGYMYYTVDYSDGSRIIKDYNDWERIDFGSFEDSWI